MPNSELLTKLDDCMAYEKLNKWLPTDWPGMDTGSYLDYVFARVSGAPVITDCRAVDLHNAVWDEKTRTLTLDVTPGAGAVLAVNGKKVTFSASGRRTLVLTVAGR